MSNEIEVVGFDPSLRNFGFSRARIDIGTYSITPSDLFLSVTESKSKVAKVVRANSHTLNRARQHYKHMIDFAKGARLAFVEVPVGSQSASGAMSNGVCFGLIAACPIPVIEVTPTEAKLAATGSKIASKAKMIEWASELYPNLPWIRTKRGGIMVPTLANEHLADSLATIHAGVATEQFAQLTSLMAA